MQGSKAIHFFSFGIALVLIYVLYSSEILGLKLFWGGLITLAPLLLLLVPTLWRNICPLGITSKLPHMMGVSRNKKISSRFQNTLMTIGLILLFVLPPLRPLLFDNSGIYTALFLLFFGFVAYILGSLYEGKSAFCNGLCPVFWVEGLYGQNSIYKFKNSLCNPCTNCAQTCLDISKDKTIEKVRSNSQSHKMTDFFIGAFPGYVFGWFQLRTPLAGEEITFLKSAYLMPFGFMLLSFAIFTVFKKIIAEKNQYLLRKIFAASAISFYYWYRIPGMFGFGPSLQNALFNLNGVFSAGAINLIRIAVIALCFLILLRKTAVES